MMRKILAPSPIPNQMTATVIMATDGMKRRNSVYGSSSFRTGRNDPIASPMGMPRREPQTNPTRIRCMLADRFSTRTPLRSSVRALLNTTVGGGNSTELTR
jgi:hypothetical protein